MDSRILGLRLLLSRRSSLAFAALGALFGAVSSVALSWDGSYYLFKTLDDQRPFVPHGRFVNVLNQAPTLFAQTFTDQVGVLRLVFGISYLAIPVVALLASFLVVRRRREGMFVWPVIAICVATLPGQVNPSSEALQAAQLVWPALLAAIVGLDRRDWVAWLVVLTTGLFAAVAHPFGVLLLGGVLLVGLLYRHWRVAVLAAVLLAVALVQAWLTADPYQGDRITIDTITYGFDHAIAGAPLIAIGTSAVGAALIAIGDRTRHRKLLGAAGVACQALAIAALVPWANNPLAWNGAIEFRTFAAVVILPMALIAVLDGWREPPASSPWRQFAAVTASAGFALIMTVQGLSVQALDGSMMDAIRAANGGCTPQESIAGVNGTMLDSWATPSRSLLFGSRTATTIVLPGDKCPLLTKDGVVPIADWDQRTEDHRWFDLKSLGNKP